VRRELQKVILETFAAVCTSATRGTTSTVEELAAFLAGRTLALINQSVIFLIIFLIIHRTDFVIVEQTFRHRSLAPLCKQAYSAANTIF
jgi:hypothetical protein